MGILDIAQDWGSIQQCFRDFYFTEDKR